MANRGKVVPLNGAVAEQREPILVLDAVQKQAVLSVVSECAALQQQMAFVQQRATEIFAAVGLDYAQRYEVNRETGEVFTVEGD